MPKHEWQQGDETQYMVSGYYNQSPAVRVGLEPPRPDDYVPPYIQGLLNRIAALEAERDAAWNAAIEAADKAGPMPCRIVDQTLVGKGPVELDSEWRATIRALKRGKS